ncbi:MAG: hypothetical protein ACLSV6_00215 [Butyricicoccus sp.]
MGYYIKNSLIRGNEEKYRVAAKGSKGHRKIPCGAGFEQSNPLLVTTSSTPKLNIGTIKTNRSAQLNFRLYAPVFAA